MSNVFVYVRPWSRNQFIDIAQGVWPDSKYIEISEHRNFDKFGFSRTFYSTYETLDKGASPVFLTEAEVEEVIIRCRLLRAIDPRRARIMVLAMEDAVETYLEKYQPEAMLSITVDSYLLHIFFLACCRRAIPFIGLVPTFVNGYFRVTGIGERNPSRQVAAAEIEEVARTLLVDLYKPTFLAQSPKELARKSKKLWFRNLFKPFWFDAKRLLLRDSMNYHYWSAAIVARRYWSVTRQVYKGVEQTPGDEGAFFRGGRPSIFLPLQMSPEATVDYWSHDISWVDYENRVVDLISKFQNKYTFVVKEHPNVLGYRTPGFYKRLAAFNNCVLVAPHVSSNQLIALCEAVVVCTGTVGFEAYVRGVPIYSDSMPFYLSDSLPRSISTLADGIPQATINREQQLECVEYLISGLLPGNFINDGTWSNKNQNHILANKQVVSSLKAYLKESKACSDTTHA